MRRLLLALALILPATLSAQRADLRGTWELDVAKSDLGQLGQMLASAGMTMNMTRVITQTDSTVSAVTTVAVAGDQQTQEQVFYTNGTPRKQTMAELGGLEATFTARWVASGLEVETKAATPMGEVRGTEIWSLSADGKTLTVSGVTQTPNGEMKLTYVHTKKSS